MEADLATALVRLAHVVDHVFVAAGRAHDLPPQQAQLLCMLIDGPVGMAELARLLRVERSSLSGLVDRARRRGLVDRVRDDTDGRACHAVLTPEGERIAVATHRAVTGMLDELAAELTAAERSRLAAGLFRMVAAHAD